MPAKRPRVATSNKPAVSTAPSRPSKRARQNNITSAEEADISEAFHLFAKPDLDDFPDEKHGVISHAEVKRALVALNVAPSSTSELKDIISALDPTSTGSVTYDSFLSVCALKLHARDTSNGDVEREEVMQAFKLFADESEDVDVGRRITLQDLMRIAAEIKLDVGREEMVAMIEEANGGKGISHGVGLREFEGVMRRSGAIS